MLGKIWNGKQLKIAFYEAGFCDNNDEISDDELPLSVLK